MKRKQLKQLSPIARALAEIEDKAVALVVRDLLFDLNRRIESRVEYLPEGPLRGWVHAWAAIVKGLDMRRAQLTPHPLCAFCFGLGRSVVEGTNGTEPCCCTKPTTLPIKEGIYIDVDD